MFSSVVICVHKWREIGDKICFLRLMRWWLWGQSRKELTGVSIWEGAAGPSPLLKVSAAVAELRKVLLLQKEQLLEYFYQVLFHSLS